MERFIVSSPTDMTKGAKALGARFLVQKDVAKKIGVDESTLSLWISGKRKPGRSYAVRLLRMFSIPVEAWEQEAK